MVSLKNGITTKGITLENRMIMINYNKGVCLANNELMKKALDNFKNRNRLYNELVEEFKEKMEKQTVWGTLCFIPLKMSKWDRWELKVEKYTIHINSLDQICEFMLKENFITKEKYEEIYRLWSDLMTFNDLANLHSVSDQCYVTPQQARFIDYWSQEEEV